MKLFVLVPTILAAMFIGYPALASDPATPILGQSRDKAEQLEFFQFFHFVRDREMPDAAHPEATVTLYNTIGSFKSYVTLGVITDNATSTITTTTLVLRRDFVDNPRTAIFARDIVKSLLTLSPGDAPESEIAGLQGEVAQNCPTSDTCNTGHPSAGYSTYAGKRDKYRITYQGGYVELQNVSLNSVPMLLVELRAQ